MTIQNLLEKELDELYKKVAEGEKRGQTIRKYRKWLAYVLKSVAGGGSLMVATGLLSSWNQFLGIAILVAIFIDTISSNHKRLIAEVEAGYAYHALRSRVRSEFNREAAPMYIKINADHESSKKEIETLILETHISLSKGIEKIEEQLKDSDIEALKSLSLDQEREKLPKGQ